MDVVQLGVDALGRRRAPVVDLDADDFAKQQELESHCGPGVDDGVGDDLGDAERGRVDQLGLAPSLELLGHEGPGPAGAGDLARQHKRAALYAALGYALHYGTISRNVTSAKSIIFAQIEEIETLRNSRRLDFKQIANAGGVDNTNAPAFFGGFSPGFRELSLNPGPDGVNGTDDDLRDAGADRTYGTPDDFDNPALVRSGYTRQVTITNLSSSMKKIEITVRYFGSGGVVGEIAGVCYLNDEARLTR